MIERDVNWVAGVALTNEAKADAFGRLNDEPVVNDIVSGQPLVVLFDPDSATAIYGLDG